MRYFLIILVFSSCFAQAQMQLNTAFGNNGVVKISAADYNEPVSVFKLQNDSLMLLANLTEKDTVIKTDIAIFKLSPDGGIDAGFGNNGYVRYDFNGMDVSNADAFLRKDDGDILVLGAGYAISNPNYKPACLMQLHSDGTVDSSFADKGTLNVQFATIEEYPRVLKKNIDGKILMGGFSSDTFHANMDVPAIALVNTNGSLDTTFGIEGKAYLRFPNGIVDASRHLIGGVLYDILPLADGTLLAAGGYSNGNNLVAFITKMFSNGAVDTTFFNKGYMAIDFTPFSNSQILKMVQAPSGLIWFGATSTALQDRDFYVGNLNLNTQDFNTASIDFSSREDMIADIQLDGNGNPFFIGKTIKEQHNYDWYRGDYFAINYSPAATFPFLGQQFIYSEDTTLQTGAVSSVRQSDGSLICYGFKDEANGNSELMLISVSTNNLSTGVKEVEKSSVSVYPNPANGMLYVSTPDGDAKMITLINLTGEVVLSRSIATGNNETALDVSSVAAGVYVVQVKNSAGVNNVKVVIR